MVVLLWLIRSSTVNVNVKKLIFANCMQDKFVFYGSIGKWYVLIDKVWLLKQMNPCKLYIKFV